MANPALPLVGTSNTDQPLGIWGLADPQIPGILAIGALSWGLNSPTSAGQGSYLLGIYATGGVTGAFMSLVPNSTGCGSAIIYKMQNLENVYSLTTSFSNFTSPTGVQTLFQILGTPPNCTFDFTVSPNVVPGTITDA